MVNSLDHLVRELYRMDDDFAARFTAARDANLGQVLLLAARLFHEAAIAEVQAAGHPHLRASHLQLAPFMGLHGARITTMAARAGITKQAVGQIVDELVALGYAAREPDPGDRRARLVVPTERGRAAMFDGLAALARVEARLRPVLADPEGLRSQLAAVAAALGPR
jgi:DNA-binding MarR family transcriptional regulator